MGTRIVSVEDTCRRYV